MRILGCVVIFLVSIYSNNLFAEDPSLLDTLKAMKGFSQMTPCPMPEQPDISKCDSSFVKSWCDTTNAANDCMIKNPQNRKAMAQMSGGPEADFYTEVKYEGEYRGVYFISLTSRKLDGTIIKDMDDSKFMSFWKEKGLKEQKNSGKKNRVKNSKAAQKDAEKQVKIIKKGSLLYPKCSQIHSKKPYSGIMAMKLKKIVDKSSCEIEGYLCNREVNYAPKSKK